MYEAKIILLCVRWYLKYSLSYRDLVEMMEERGIYISHTTIMRCVHQYAPMIDKIQCVPSEIEFLNTIFGIVV